MTPIFLLHVLFLSNQISLNQPYYAMKLGKPRDQFTLKSKKAFQELRFEGYESVESSLYYAKRKSRDEEARASYLQILDSLDEDGVYLRDLIHKEKIYAYKKEYLEDAMNNLGDALDYAVSICGLTSDAFLSLFIISRIADQFESGVAKFVAGLSGAELVLTVLSSSGISRQALLPPPVSYARSEHYWCGYILAYFQWKTGMSFRKILSTLPASEIERMYPALHEASEEKAVDTFLDFIKAKRKPTNLQTIRKAKKMSQKTLSSQSGVSLRNIQQYEQRVKSINKAAVETLICLYKTLGCRMKDLIEPF